MTESDVDELPAEKFFKALTGDQKDSNYSIVCGNITTDSDEEKKINEICKKLGQNIYYVEDAHKDNSLFYDKHCYDLNYWLYDELTTKLDAKIQKQWNGVNTKGKSNNNGKICKPQSQLFKTGLFKSIKNYLITLKIMKQLKEKETENTETKIYCDYIKERVSLYFTFKQLCQLMKNDICQKYLKDYDDDRYNPTELLSKFKCAEEGKYEVELDESLITEMIKTYQSNFGNLLTGFGNILPGFGSIIPGLGSIMP
ncbi:CYIR protein, partial [Plasmodium cynomolgi strain B]